MLWLLLKFFFSAHILHCADSFACPFHSSNNPPSNERTVSRRTDRTERCSCAKIFLPPPPAGTVTSTRGRKVGVNEERVRKVRSCHPLSKVLQFSRLDLICLTWTRLNGACARLNLIKARLKLSYRGFASTELGRGRPTTDLKRTDFLRFFGHRPIHEPVLSRILAHTEARNPLNSKTRSQRPFLQSSAETGSHVQSM